MYDPNEIPCLHAVANFRRLCITIVGACPLLYLRIISRCKLVLAHPLHVILSSCCWSLGSRINPPERNDLTDSPSPYRFVAGSTAPGWQPSVI